jgi:hypothetical protein
MPLAEIVPLVAAQLTAVLVVPVTVAVNCWVLPTCSNAEAGLTVMATCEPALDNVQPARKTTSSEEKAMASFRANVREEGRCLGWPNRFFTVEL